MATASGSTARQRDAVAEVLLRMRVELQRLDLWESSPPAAHRLTSAQPFSWDTLMFHQWLQWRFIPRMSRAVDGREIWPRDSAIYPYAEECFAAREHEVRELLFLIATLVELISGRREVDAAHAVRH